MSKKQSSDNRIILASAGSRKTTYLVDEAFALSAKRILITTFTNQNADQLRKYFYQKYGCIPPTVTILPWFTFLLSHCVRPYQHFKYDKHRIDKLILSEGISARYKAESDDKHYLLDKRTIYSDKLSKFSIKCNELSSGLVIDRLESLFDLLFVDEVQDFSGEDLDLLQVFLASKIRLTCVGDPRQSTFSTNNSRKNSRFKGFEIEKKFRGWERKGLCTISSRTDCYRSVQSICDFGDRLYPSMANTVSKNMETVDHLGIFCISKKEAIAYHQTFSPQSLCWNILSNTLGLDAINFGLSKGSTFDRVLIFPTKEIENYLQTGNPENLKDGTKAKLYVAITRAKFSVTFVYEGERFSNDITPFSAS